MNLWLVETKNGTTFVHKAMYSQSLEDTSFSSGFPFALESTLSTGRYFSCAKSGTCDLSGRNDQENAEFTATVVSDFTSSFDFRPELYRRFTRSHLRYMSCKWEKKIERVNKKGVSKVVYVRECQLLSPSNCPVATRDSDPRCIPNGIELVEQPE